MYLQYAKDLFKIVFYFFFFLFVLFPLIFSQKIIPFKIESRL